MSYTSSVRVRTGDEPWAEYPSVPFGEYVAVIITLPPASAQSNPGNGVMTALRDAGYVEFLFIPQGIDDVLARLTTDLAPTHWYNKTTRSWEAGPVDLTQTVMLMSYSSEQTAAALYFALKRNNSFCVLAAQNLLGAVVDMIPAPSEMRYATAHAVQPGDISVAISVIEQELRVLP